MSSKAIVLGLALAACSGKQGGAPATGSGEAPPPAGGCEAVRAKIEALYRADARAKERALSLSGVEEAVADNTRMVMIECAKAPAQVSACVAGVTTVADLEHACLAPLDDEGTEGDAFRNH